MKKISFKSILICILCNFICILCNGQTKIDFKQMKIYGGTGQGIMMWQGTVHDTLTSPGDSMVPITFNGNTEIGWYKITSTGGGSGTVTLVSPGYGTDFTAITGTGSIIIDTTIVLNKTGVQLLTNKFISGSTNTFSNIPNSALTNSTISGVSLGGTLGAHSVSYGLSGSNYTGAGAVAWSADTTSATALVSKTRLTNTLGSYVNALSAIGASANANGATITGSTLNLQPASASFGGVVTTGTQTMAGAKTFSSTVTGSASPAFTIGTYGAGIRGTASGNTTWLQLEQAGGNPIAIWLGNTTLDYSILELMDPGGTLNTNNFEFSCLGGGYSTNGLLAANSLLAWTRSGLTNGYRMGTQSGPVILFTGGFATTNERVRILNTGEMAVSGTATPLTTPTAHLHIAAGAAGAGKAPLKFSSGTDLTTPEAGAWEYDGTNLHFSPSTTRYNVALYLPGSATLDFASTAAQSSSDLTITVTGAADGDPVLLGNTNASTLTNSSYSAWVSAANTVTVRFNNYSAGAQDPASATFRVKVIKN